jgi:hypothetical protein
MKIHLTLVISALTLSFLAISTASAAVTNLTLLPDTIVSGVAPVGIEGDFAPGMSSGSWQAAVPLGAVSPNNYTQLFLTPDMLFGRDDVTVGELASISYWTKKDSLHTAVPADWFFQIYTKPYAGSPGSAWYGNRINSEPYFSQNLNAPADTWNQWVTDANQDNRLRFFDSSSGYFGGYGDGFLSDLTSNPAYENQEIMFINVATGTAWAAGFAGQIDGLQIELTDGSIANVNFEATAIPEPGAITLAGLAIIGMICPRRTQR